MVTLSLDSWLLCPGLFRLGKLGDQSVVNSVVPPAKGYDCSCMLA